MKKMTRILNNTRRGLALLLALIFAFSIAPALSRAEAADTLSISNVSELKSFIKSCSMDSYSKGLSVVLTDDIDMGGASINSIPIFTVALTAPRTRSPISPSKPKARKSVFSALSRQELR